MREESEEDRLREESLEELEEGEECKERACLKLLKFEKGLFTEPERCPMRKLQSINSLFISAVVDDVA